MAAGNPRTTRVSRVVLTDGQDAELRTTRLSGVVFYKPLEAPIPAASTDGWPGRAGRMNYGPEMRDERYTADPQRELSAEQVNLLWWQLGAMGMGAPKVVVHYSPLTPPFQISYAALAWDQQLYTGLAAGATPSDFSMILPGVGNYTFVFNSQVLGRPNEDGVQELQPLQFQQGLITPSPVGVPADQLVAEFELITTSAFNVRMRDASGALVDQPFTVAVW